MFPTEAIIKPYFLPRKLITLVAIIAPIAIPTTEIDIGRVAKDLIGLIFEPIIPLKKTVIGAAVKLKIWLSVNKARFLFIKRCIYHLNTLQMLKPFQVIYISYFFDVYFFWN